MGGALSAHQGARPHRHVRRLARNAHRRRGARRGPYPGASGGAIADLAVASGLSLAELGALDPDDYQAISEAVDRQRWGNVEELLACILEQLGYMHRLAASAAGIKGNDLPVAVRWPRPGDKGKVKPPASTRAEIRARIRNANPQPQQHVEEVN